MNQSNNIGHQDRLHLLRLIVLLDLLTGTGGVRTSRLHQGLEARNITISKRQLQRDLGFLARHFLVEQYENENGIWLWSWQDSCSRRGPWQAGDDFVPSLPLENALRQREAVDSRDSSLTTLLRVLVIVELIPLWIHDQWISMPELRAGLERYGLSANVRTLQRDIQFIRKHFLIVVEKGRGGKTFLQRLENDEWQTSFCPRLPESDASNEADLELFREVSLRYPHWPGAAW